MVKKNNMIEYKDLTYSRPRASTIDQLDKETLKVLEWVGKSKTVLEMGCHTGNLSEWLQKNECKVTGVDINEQALKIARPYLDNWITGNIEHESFWKQLQGKKFDVITFMHVLEHLTDPWEVLNVSKNYLTQEGVIIVGLPNILNAKDRFNMFFGEFNYTKEGVMDQTHLRFFNYKTAHQLIEQADLKITGYYSPWQVNPIHCFIDHLPVIWRMKNLFKLNKVPVLFRERANLTDVVMLFKCELKK